MAKTTTPEPDYPNENDSEDTDKTQTKLLQFPPLCQKL